MEIVSGILRGMPLRAPSGQTARPTAVRAREALFASLGPLNGIAAADLFAGTGALGLEAASHGASSVLFVDASKSSCNAIKSNCEKAETIARTAEFEIFSGALPGCCKRIATHIRPDVIFADPPYAESAELLARLLADPDFPVGPPTRCSSGKWRKTAAVSSRLRRTGNWKRSAISAEQNFSICDRTRNPVPCLTPSAPTGLLPSF